MRVSMYMKDHTNQFFGRLFVEEFLGKTPSGKCAWKARCTCGTENVIVLSGDLTSSDTKSCGCLKKEATATRNKSRAIASLAGVRHREYASWLSAKRRCLEPTDKDYCRYGAAGVTFCSAWAESFSAFYDHVGDRPVGTTLDRIDNNKGYEPGNVRWATAKEQAMNRRNTRWHIVDGIKMSTSDAAKHFNVSDAAILKVSNKKGTLDGYHPRRHG